MNPNPSKRVDFNSRYLDLFVTTLAQSVALGFVVVASTFIGAFLGITVSSRPARAASTQNVVTVTAAESGDENRGLPVTDSTDPEAQVQPAPDNTEVPPVHTRAAASETVSGAKYPAGPETVVDPNGNVKLTNEPVVEKVDDTPVVNADPTKAKQAP